MMVASNPVQSRPIQQCVHTNMIFTVLNATTKKLRLCNLTAEDVDEALEDKRDEQPVGSKGSDDVDKPLALTNGTGGEGNGPGSPAIVTPSVPRGPSLFAPIKRVTGKQDPSRTRSPSKSNWTVAVTDVQNEGNRQKEFSEPVF